MPELPEVETARSLIAGRALHRTIVGVDDADTYVTRPHTPGQLRDALVGRELTAVMRRGKTIWAGTSGVDGDPAPGPDLGIHLGMSGRIVITAPGGEAAEGFDKRRLGRVRLDPDVTALGPDAEEITAEEFRHLLSKGTIAVKARLLDQSRIAGVGNLLADEALWQARISPARPVGRLSPAEVDRLYQALQATLKSAATQGGAHTGEVIPFRHAGARCPRDGAEMKHAVVGGRSTWWCSAEQG